jgi:hypothetical protein
MSIDVEIIPTVPKLFTWGALKASLVATQLSKPARALIGESPQLVDLRTKQRVADNLPLDPKGFYAFEFREGSTLAFDIDRNADCYTNEEEYLQDFGRNLDTNTIEQLAKVWKEIGISYQLESYAGRHRHEPEVFVAVAAIVADLCSGRIIVKDSDLFSVPVGIYSAAQFRDARATFFVDADGNRY